MTRRNLFQAIFGAIAAAFLPHKAVKEKEKSCCLITDTTATTEGNIAYYYVGEKDIYSGKYIWRSFSPAFSNEEVDIYTWNDGQPVWTLKLS
jgi:hypothetical protein